nr:MAG TPA: hypothetical protein [Caudoviricetes sp.]
MISSYFILGQSGAWLSLFNAINKNLQNIL